MWPVFPLSFTSVLVVVMFGLALGAMRFVQPAWWRSRRLWTLVAAVAAVDLAGVALWIGGDYAGNDAALCRGAQLVYTTVLLGLPASIVLPVSAWIDRLLTRKRGADEMAKGKDAASRFSRRALLRFGAGSMPAVAASVGASGLVTGREDPVLRIVPMRFSNLHPDLHGLKILQLSDLHLGAYRTPEDVERALENVRVHSPDLIVVTGDLADYPPFIPPALAAITKSKPRYGAFACLGNHEYLHDITDTRTRMEASDVPLLVGEGRTIAIGRARLFVAGADDPVVMSGDIAAKVRPSIESAARHASADDDFRLLLCHRPEGLGPAADNDFDLTLAGHTHGGQVGLLGKSLFELLGSKIPWWGAYSRPRRNHPRGPSRLFTTSGFGHWFPFRVGCPTEMALVVLEGPSGPAMTPVS